MVDVLVRFWGICGAHVVGEIQSSVVEVGDVLSFVGKVMVGVAVAV